MTPSAVAGVGWVLDLKYPPRGDEDGDGGWLLDDMGLSGGGGNRQPDHRHETLHPVLGINGSGNIGFIEELVRVHTPLLKCICNRPHTTFILCFPPPSIEVNLEQGIHDKINTFPGKGGLGTQFSIIHFLKLQKIAIIAFEVIVKFLRPKRNKAVEAYPPRVFQRKQPTAAMSGPGTSFMTPRSREVLTAC